MVGNAITVQGVVISLITALLFPEIAFKLTLFLNSKSNIFLVNKKLDIFLSFKERKHELQLKRT